MNKAKIKKISTITLNVLLYLFLALCILSVIITVLSKRDSDGATNVFGYQMRIVTSDSMTACEFTDVSAYEIKDIPIRSMIFIETVPKDQKEAQEWYRDLKVGDVLTFRYVYTRQVTITHRIVHIEEKETGGFLIELAGDNKDSDSQQLKQVIKTAEKNSPNYVIGKVTGQSLPFGFVLSILQTKVGIVCILIIPCLIIILLEILKMIKIINSDKKAKLKEETVKKDNELEELRRRIAELEANKNSEQNKTEDESNSQNE